MTLISGPALNVIIFLVILALLIFVAWLIGKFQQKKYHDDAVEYMLRPERAPVTLNTWGVISDAAENGVMTCSASCELEERADQVQLTVYSKDRSVIENFTQNVKFQFSPIYTQPPVDIFQRLWITVNAQRTPSAKSSKDKSPSPDSIVLDAYDLLLEFGMQTDRSPVAQTKKDGVNSQDKNKPYFAVGFNIDPTIKRIHALGSCRSTCSCNRKEKYDSKEKNITVTVSVSVGEVEAILGSSSIVKAGQSTTKPLSNPNGYTKTLSISGRKVGDNTYRLTGTWNVN